MTGSRKSALTAVADYVPPEVLGNEELVAGHESWTAEKILEKTGIRHRHVAGPGVLTSGLAAAAGQRLIDEHQVDPATIDFVILVTVTPDQLVPFAAAALHRALGLSSAAGALDVILGCSGYAYGLSLAAGLVESGRAERVLLTTADRFTPIAGASELSSRSLFGDGGTASLIEPAEQAGAGAAVIGRTRYGTDGAGIEHLVIPDTGLRGWLNQDRADGPPRLHMNGHEVFDFALRVVPPFVKQFLETEGLSRDDVDHFVFHQANLFMLQHLRRRLRIPEERFVVNIEEVGNTNASTIPMALAKLGREGRFSSGDVGLLAGFGTGYSWSAARLDWI